MRNIMKMVFVLFIACGLAAGSLAVVYAVTKERIDKQEEEQQQQACKEVFAGADSFEDVNPPKRDETGKVIKPKEKPKEQVFKALRNGEVVGHVFIKEVQGYSGPIRIAFGMDNNGIITGFKTITQTETPGLGAKIKTDPQFKNQFKDKTIAQIALKKDDPNGQIDAITGATISSRAVVKAVRSAYDTFSAVENDVTDSDSESGDESSTYKAAFRAVFTGADKFKVVTPGHVWSAMSGTDGKLLGHVILVSDIQGYNGKITLAFGVDAAGLVAGLSIIDQSETEGYGAEIASQKFMDQFKNKRLEQIALKNDDPTKGQIDAITGATISSRAVTDAVYSALDSFNKEKTGETK